MEAETEFTEALSGEGQRFDDAWAKFLFNFDQLTILRSLGKEVLMSVMQAGLRYTGSGWNTGRAARTLYEVSGVALVCGNFQSYRDIWLYMLALCA